ncbi:MAG: 4'-phosphopantetheinyl transferase superfamily protein [Planctomycetota bacterium]|nr:4'-phosphopantetheinyl transferase superfamily protein [Planctomycetota bacterium]
MESGRGRGHRLVSMPSDLPLPPLPAPEGAQVRVWRVDLRPRPSELEMMRSLLTAEELERAARFVFDVHRVRWTMGRGALRTILGRTLGRPPASLAFQAGPHGKPFLAEDEATGPWFNLSHSGDHALLAIAAAGEVGVDIELHDPRRATDELMEHYFAAGERQAIGAMDTSSRMRAFFDCWTRKEAFIKAVGDGLSFPLDEFEVRTAARDAALLSIRGDRRAAARWTLVDLELDLAASAALAVHSEECSILLDRWSLELE